jgi:uncharacterized protein with HEPN domain
MDPRDRWHLDLARTSARMALEYRRSVLDWRSDQKTIDAIAKRVEESSEHLRRVSPGQQAAMPEIPWKAAKGIRDILAHDYLRLDLDVLEATLDDDVPALIAAIDLAIGP